MQICHAYLEGTHTPRSFKQFAGVLSMLDTLHKLNYVHGDIRKENIIFATNKCTSYLIDFELAKAEGSRYPSGYRYYKEFRYQNAREHYPLWKEHDRYSLGCVMKDLCPNLLFQSIITKVNNSSISLKDRIKELEEFNE